MPYGGITDAFEGTLQDWSEGNWETLTKEWLNPVYYLAMPMGGGQLKKTVQGLKMFDDDLPISGSYTDNGDLRFPVEDTPKNRIQAAIFGQYANENARAYFDNDVAPLKEKQIQEFIDIDAPIADYWKYRKGLTGLKTLNEKGDYIGGLDFPVSTKNILINNIADRDEPIDYTGFENFSSFEEFDFASRFPEKYALSKVITGDIKEYTKITSALNDIEADKKPNGDAISGSAKRKKAEYINGLDIDYGAKLILFKKAFNGDNRYNSDIIEYLTNRKDISYEDKVIILKELGFDVDSAGNVSWG
jgi:hypothetical protein